MRAYYEDESVTLNHGDCLDVMADLPDASVDAIVTDPPYGLGFMGREWDDLPPGEDWARECLRVLKPGGHLLAFGGTRTWHRLVVAVEDAGFEVRDSIAWLYGSGFPKSLNLTGERAGWGTALKPAFEPIVVARKPLIGTVAANVLAHGTGALNVDGCRVGREEGDRTKYGRGNHLPHANTTASLGKFTEVTPYEPHTAGRWPTNVILDGEATGELDRQSGLTRSTTRKPTGRDTRGIPNGNTPVIRVADTQERGVADEGGASRFFPTFRYEAKAPTDERPRVNGVAHPTVKPLDLMRWLIRLVTPPGGTVLEPFAGSGTTAEACVIEGFRCIAIEREAAYLPLIVARLSKPIQADLFGGAP